jgi:hypothetical protein
MFSRADHRATTHPVRRGVRHRLCAGHPHTDVRWLDHPGAAVEPIRQSSVTFTHAIRASPLNPASKLFRPDDERHDCHRDRPARQHLGLLSPPPWPVSGRAALLSRSRRAMSLCIRTAN